MRQLIEMVRGDTPDSFRLNPATRVLWRSGDAVQLELGSRSIVVDGVDEAWITALVSGRRSPLPEPPGSAEAMRALSVAGYVWRRTPADNRVQPHPARLAEDACALAATYGRDAPAVLARRRDAAVQLVGAGRLAAAVGAALASAGIGLLDFTETRATRLRDTSPGGIPAAHEGLPFAEAARATTVGGAPEAQVSPIPDGRRPDLVILADGRSADGALRTRLHVRRIPYLGVTTGTSGATIGQLVLPGLTSCHRCTDLHHGERDPSWSLIAAQRAGADTAQATDTATAMVAAALTTASALAFLDGDEPPTLGAALRVERDSWQIRRQLRPPHERCDCTGGQ